MLGDHNAAEGPLPAGPQFVALPSTDIQLARRHALGPTAPSYAARLPLRPAAAVCGRPDGSPARPEACDQRWVARERRCGRSGVLGGAPASLGARGWHAQSIGTACNHGDTIAAPLAAAGTAACRLLPPPIGPFLAANCCPWVLDGVHRIAPNEVHCDGLSRAPGLQLAGLPAGQAHSLPVRRRLRSAAAAAWAGHCLLPIAPWAPRLGSSQTAHRGAMRWTVTRTWAFDGLALAAWHAHSFLVRR